MRKYITAVLSLLVFLGALSLPVKLVVGQEVEQRTLLSENFPLPEVGKKNPWLAVGVAWLVPTLGHAYAGDWERGIKKFLVIHVACSTVVGIGTAITPISQTGGTVLQVIGYIGLFVSRIWEYVDAYKTAEDYNKKLVEKCGIRVSFHQGKPYLQLSYKF